MNIEDILKLLQQLPDAHRTVFNLAILDGYTHREIADILEKESWEFPQIILSTICLELV